MSTYLTPADHVMIKKMKEDDGLSIRAIAKKLHRSETTISAVLNGSTPRYRRPPPPKIPLRDERDGYPDFSSLPNDVLFQHVRECNFIV